MKFPTGKPTKPALPFGLKETDTAYPKHPKKYDWRKPQPFDVLHTLTLYETERFGWVVTTLHIRNPGSRHRTGAQARTYGVNAEGQVVTVGLGPHVKRTLTVYVTRARADALKTLTDLHERGLADAGSIRDRISSRRAQGAMRRSSFGFGLGF
ncbi:hypothetical protein [Bradyrhizobium erythrophlei]|uniref:Uncharacterized protein n=1 Tax=Bradyrhizobium erythrophlei TaxID=1437360 RepID=A0A1M5NI63_9BRAD|nr:hypothetical protein [Bradyrhizobium erythrophlei]SHG89211.1 hypothetical protein SAMN05443248_3006 [Bradyrhizobium erythrophlei]